MATIVLPLLAETSGWFRQAGRLKSFRSRSKSSGRMPAALGFKTSHGEAHSAGSTRKTRSASWYCVELLFFFNIVFTLLAIGRNTKAEAYKIGCCNVLNFICDSIAKHLPKWSISLLSVTEFPGSRPPGTSGSWAIIGSASSLQRPTTSSPVQPWCISTWVIWSTNTPNPTKIISGKRTE